MQLGSEKILPRFIEFPFEKITPGEDVIAVTTASITIPVPPVFKHLVLFTAGRTDSADAFTNSVAAQYNGDTGSNYYNQYVAGINNAASALGGAVTTSSAVGVLSGGGLPANQAASSVTFFPHYRGDNIFKNSIEIMGGATAATTFQATVQTSFWLSTARIQSIKLFPSNGNIAANSIISLYGIR